MSTLTSPSPIPLTADYNKQPMARAIPGAYYCRDTKQWVLGDPTPRSAAVCLRLFPELAFEYPELEELRDSLAQDVRPFDNATPFDHRIMAPAVELSLAAEGKSFYDFQSLDLGYIAEVLDEHGGAYIGWERGLGKTLATCALIDALDCRHTLIVCPNTAKQSVWADELSRWLPHLIVIVLPNARAHREKSLAHVRQLQQAGIPFVLVVHYEALALVEANRRDNWRTIGEWDLITADEAHRLKNPATKMARALKKIPSSRRLALSGSIIQNHAEELFSVLQWLFPERYRSKWRDWNDRYLDYVDSGYGRVCIGIKLERLEQMREELGVFMVYRRKEDELDLPSKTEQTLLVGLSPNQRRAYDELVGTCVARLDDGSVVKAQEGLVMLTRLRQVATGLDLVGDTVSDSSKLDLTLDLIEDNPDEAFVVFTWFKIAGRTLAERLRAKGIECFVVDGDVKHETRADYIERFQGGEGRVFIGTLSTLSESVTLHRATNAIFLDRSWNPATNVQAADRIYRIGQDRPVTITHLVAKNTVDELRVLPTIANKEALRALILGGTS